MSTIAAATTVLTGLELANTVFQKLEPLAVDLFHRAEQLFPAKQQGVQKMSMVVTVLANVVDILAKAAEIPSVVPTSDLAGRLQGLFSYLTRPGSGVVIGDPVTTMAAGNGASTSTFASTSINVNKLPIGNLTDAQIGAIIRVLAGSVS